MAAESVARHRRWWAPITAGALLCLACCAAPLLIAAGLLGSGTILVTASWLEPLGLALIAAGIVGLVRARTRRSRTPGCGCSTSAGTAAGPGDEVGDSCSCAPAAAPGR